MNEKKMCIFVFNFRLIKCLFLGFFVFLRGLWLKC